METALNTLWFSSAILRFEEQSDVTNALEKMSILQIS